MLPTYTVTLRPDEGNVFTSVHYEDAHEHVCLLNSSYSSLWLAMEQARMTLGKHTVEWKDEKNAEETNIHEARG